MNEITTLFTAIGDFFTKSDWSAMVKWPFWILLFTTAAGGVYCARFGKKTLVNQSVCSTLTLVTIYLGAALFYLHVPSLRTAFSELPFLVVTDKSVALLDPFSMDPTLLPQVLLRLMILVFLVTAADSFRTGGKTVFSWFLSQILTVILGLGLYALITAGITLLLPSLLTRYAAIPVILIVLGGLLALCAKFIFTVVLNGENPIYNKVFKFLTANRGGSLFTVSALSFLVALTVLSALQITGKTVLTYASANTVGLWIVMLLVHITLFLFCMFFSDRKKG